VGVTGHSFGGLTSFRAAALDGRITAIAPQCPTSTDLALLGLPPAPLAIPILIQGSRLDRTLPWADNIAPAWAALTTPATAPRWLLELKTGGHFTMSDLCAFELARIADGIQLDLPNTDIKSTLSDGCGPPAPSASVAQTLLAHFVIAFFNAQLKGSAGSLALLSQSSAEALGPGLSAVSTAQPQ
jgi:predicted dienelactone hydrolase